MRNAAFLYPRPEGLDHQRLTDDESLLEAPRQMIALESLTLLGVY